ncbi:MAG: hypothetical protein H6657_14750 [Ardenticatenaceae bacterium]|nr:hypothetical protein [Ardenticatenaceae bacterium]
MIQNPGVKLYKEDQVQVSKTGKKRATRRAVALSTGSSMALTEGGSDVPYAVWLFQSRFSRASLGEEFFSQHQTSQRVYIVITFFLRAKLQSFMIRNGRFIPILDGGEAIPLPPRCVQKYQPGKTWPVTSLGFR